MIDIWYGLKVAQMRSKWRFVVQFDCPPGMKITIKSKQFCVFHIVGVMFLAFGRKKWNQRFHTRILDFWTCWLKNSQRKHEASVFISGTRRVHHAVSDDVKQKWGEWVIFLALLLMIEESFVSLTYWKFSLSSLFCYPLF